MGEEELLPQQERALWSIVDVCHVKDGERVETPVGVTAAEGGRDSQISVCGAGRSLDEPGLAISEATSLLPMGVLLCSSCLASRVVRGRYPGGWIWVILKVEPLTAAALRTHCPNSCSCFCPGIAAASLSCCGPMVCIPVVQVHQPQGTSAFGISYPGRVTRV